MGALLPAFHKQSRIHRLVKQNGAADGDTDLVLEELFKCADMVLNREWREQRTTLEDEETEIAEVHGG